MRSKNLLSLFLISASFSLVALPTDLFAQKKAPERVSRRGLFQVDQFQAFDVPQAEIRGAFLQKIREEIQVLNNIAKKTSDPNRKADLLFRIAENYTLQEKAQYFQEMEEYNAKFDAYLSGELKTEPKKPPEFKNKTAYKIYKAIINSAPRYQRIDSVLFLTGVTAQRNDDPRAHEFFQQVVNKFPKSSHRLDALMELGDYYFRSRRFNEAIRTFQKILEEPNRLYNFSLYKISWCYYNQNKVRSAMGLMQNVVKNSKGVKNELDLREEALNDLVIFYSDLGLIDEAQKYFISINEPEYGIKVLERLAETYFKQSRYQLAISTLKRLMQAVPYGDTRPRHHSKLIESYEKSSDLKTAMYEMEQFVATYGKESKWWEINTDADARDYAYSRGEVYARFLPKRYHEEAQKIEDREPKKAQGLYQAAIVYYKKYLDRFDKHENSYDIRFLYSELLFKNGNYDLASKEFALVVAANPKGKHAKRALVGQIDSLTRLEEAHFKDLQKRGVKKKDLYDPIPLSEFAKALVDADETFIKLFPDDPDIAQTKLHRAQLYYNYNQFDRAEKAFFEIIQQHPSSAASHTARHLVLDIYNLRKDWENLEKWASTFLGDRDFAQGENRDLLLKLIQGSIFQRAKQFEDKKQYREAATTYLRLTNKYPDSEFADKALFNAAIAYINADDSERAMSLARRFLSKYPKSEMTPKMMLAMASYFDDKLDFANAAYYYEQLAEIDPKSSFASDALFNAGLYREHLGQYSKALQNYDLYIKRYPSAKDAADIFFSMGLIQEKQRRYKAAIDVFSMFPRKYGSKVEKNVEAYYRMGTSYRRLGNAKESARAFQTAVFLFRKYNKDPKLSANVGAKYAAKAYFELQEDSYRKYQSIRLRMPESYLARAIEEKARLLQSLKNRYLEIIGYGDAEMGVASLYQVGLIYQEFSDALFQAPVPGGLTPEEVNVYKTELQNRAFPIEEKAIEAYEKAVQKAYELDVYSEWTEKAYQRLSQYKPNDYPSLQGQTMKSLHLSEPIAPIEKSELKGGAK